MGAKLAQSLSSSSNNDFMKYLPFRNKNSMFCSPVTPDEIIRILYKFPNNKAPWGDGINSKVLKVIGSSIVTPLAHIFDIWFTSGEVPELLKVAKVIPIYKRGERNQPGNYYRPISLLVAWHSGRTSVSDWRTFPVLRSTCSWWVTTNVGSLNRPLQVSQPG